MKPSIRFKTPRVSLLVSFALWFAIAPALRAGCQNGCLSNENTVLGDDALINWDPNFSNDSTAIGYNALHGYNPFGGAQYVIEDTAVGAYALKNHSGTSSQHSNTAVGAYALEGPGNGLESAPNQDTAVGVRALQNARVTFSNVAVGYQALLADAIGYENTAVGHSALLNNTVNDETAIGYAALSANTTGYSNTAAGAFALTANQTGAQNTAVGLSALGNNDANDNTAHGFQALMNNAYGVNNTATGSNALLNNNADNNTADGFQALMNNGAGGSNTATGGSALTNNTAGSFNTANGAQALNRNTTGASNVAEGSFALFSNTMGNSNVAVGFDALFNTTGGSNIGVGLSAGADLTTGDNNIDIGNRGVAGESNTIRIGTSGTQTNAYMAGIYGINVPRGLSVVVDFMGHLGTKGSSERFKDAIKPMDKASEAILALKPVTFRYKKEFDPDGTPQFGLVAEDVAKVNPDLVVRDGKGQLYAVRYDAVNAMLLNEFLKEHKRVEAQQAMIADLKSTVAQQQKSFQSRLAEQEKQIETLTSGLQKVSAQLEIIKPAQRVIANNP